MTHGDLRPTNIIVDRDMNIVGLIDWEFTYVVPLQLLVPPGWIAGYEVNKLEGKEQLLTAELSKFESAVVLEESRYSPRFGEGSNVIPLSSLWKDMGCEKFFIANALLQPRRCGHIYWGHLDRLKYDGGYATERINDFYQVQKGEVEVLKKKVEDLKGFTESAKTMGIEMTCLSNILPEELIQEIAAIHEDMKKVKASLGIAG